LPLYKLSCSWLLGVCHSSWLLLPACEGFPLPPCGCLGCPTLFSTCLFCCYCLLFSFSFFPWLGVSLSSGLWWFGPRLSVGVPLRSGTLWSTLWVQGAHLVVRVFPSHLGAGIWQWCGSPPGFLFNVKRRCYVQAGCVEKSKFCLFWVFFL
jgi:hypothetical protein